MTTNITIESFHYFGHDNTRDFNSKVLYRKNGKLYLAHVYVCFFNKAVYFPRQPKEGKVLKGLHEAIMKHQRL